MPGRSGIGRRAALALPLVPAARARAVDTYDIVVRGGLVHDGHGGAPFVADVAIRGDRIAAVAPKIAARGRHELDAHGLAVAPGFINVLSHAFPALYEDGRALSDVRQGVTLEIFGETSWGPVDERQRRNQSAAKHRTPWTTLGQFLDWLVARGISPNVASFVSAGTLRQLVVGAADRPATADELGRMRAHVEMAMRQGALGLTTALAYAPARFARTDELIALARVAAAGGGSYVAHLRDEGDELLAAVDEHLQIAREAALPAEIYHLKAAGRRNWPLLPRAIAKIEEARAAGLRITANAYPYTAASTGLTAWLPGWLQDGGTLKALARMKEPAIRARVERELGDARPAAGRLVAAPEEIVLADVRKAALRPLVGKTLAAVAAARGRSPAATAMDLIVEDESKIPSIFFVMAEGDVRRVLALPWVSVGSDAPALAPGPPLGTGSVHPRAYGSFARFLGKYVRDEKLVPLPDAIRRLTSLPATTFRLPGRGALTVGHFADVVVFDPARIADTATYERPHQLAIGVVHVLVNGRAVIRDGEHTGARPGQVVRVAGVRPRAAPRR